MAELLRDDPPVALRRDGGSGARSGRSTDHGIRKPMRSAIVGSTSIVRSGLSLTPSATLAGSLYEERDRGDVLYVRGADQPTVVTQPEADAVVGDHGNNRPVVDTRLVQPVEDIAEQTVGGLKVAAGGAGSSA